MVAVPLAVTVTALHAVPADATENVSAEVMVGATPMVMVSAWLAVPLTSLADRLTVAVPVEGGVPVMRPVEASKLAHAGRPLTLKAMGAVPVAVTA